MAAVKKRRMASKTKAQRDIEAIMRMVPAGPARAAMVDRLLVKDARRVAAREYKQRLRERVALGLPVREYNRKGEVRVATGLAEKGKGLTEAEKARLLRLMYRK